MDDEQRPEWPHPHPPRHGCGCGHCYAWLMGRHAVNDPDPIRTWRRIYGELGA